MDFFPPLELWQHTSKILGRFTDERWRICGVVSVVGYFLVFKAGVCAGGQVSVPVMEIYFLFQTLNFSGGGKKI